MKSYVNLDSINPVILQAAFPETLIAKYMVGSRAYGTSRPDSDIDYRGIFVLPSNAYLSIEEPVRQIADEKNDTTFYTLKRFLELAATANPNIIEMLFMPPDCRIFEDDLMRPLLENRDLFVTREAYRSHLNYALAQTKRAKGRNKWVNNPKPESLPSELDFCSFIPRVTPEGSFPMRPIPIRESGVDLAFCKCAGLEHLPNAYRIYRYEKPDRGIFRNGMLVCESIPREDEIEKCVGILIYNRAEHERAIRDHANYWQWRKNRNDARWLSQEKGERDYDAKNMMHTFRLLLSGENILLNGVPIVRFEGERLQILLDIRDGKYEYDELRKMIERKLESLEAAMTNSNLPETADREKIDKLLREMTEAWEKRQS